MGVRDTLEAARESARDLQRIEERAELLRGSIGVQGHSYDFHAKVGILDPMRQVDALLDWQEEHEGIEGLKVCIEEARILIDGAARILDSLSIEALRGYYIEGRSIHAVVARLYPFSPTLMGMGEKDRQKVVQAAIDHTTEFLESVGYAHLREMGLAY